MSRIIELEALLKELQGVDAGHAKEAFTTLFQRGCLLLDLEDDDAALAFETSRPNASRWRRGLVVPPAAGLVLRFLRGQVEAKVKKLRRIEAAQSGLGHVRGAPTALAAKGR
jgi:hypothetical protein